MAAGRAWLFDADRHRRRRPRASVRVFLQKGDIDSAVSRAGRGRKRDQEFSSSANRVRRKARFPRARHAIERQHQRGHGFMASLSRPRAAPCIVIDALAQIHMFRKHRLVTATHGSVSVERSSKSSGAEQAAAPPVPYRTTDLQSPRETVMNIHSNPPSSIKKHSLQPLRDKEKRITRGFLFVNRRIIALFIRPAPATADAGKPFSLTMRCATMRGARLPSPKPGRPDGTHREARTADRKREPLSAKSDAKTRPVASAAAVCSPMLSVCLPTSNRKAEGEPLV